MRLRGKVCIVTGGGRGIGRAVACRMAQEGAKIVFTCDISNDGFNELEREYPNLKGRVLNVTDRVAIKIFVQEIVEEHDRIDVLVNNAGITRDALIHKMTDDDWDTVIDINLKGVFNMTRFIAPFMMEAGSGSIVSVSSIVALDGNIGQSNYAASKGGIVSLTRTWAKEFSRKGARVRANAVAPGFMRTAMTEKVPENILEGIVARVPLKRMGEAQDVANLVLFLASDEASYITGQVIRVDGGLVF